MQGKRGRGQKQFLFDQLQHRDASLLMGLLLTAARPGGTPLRFDHGLHFRGQMQGGVLIADDAHINPAAYPQTHGLQATLTYETQRRLRFPGHPNAATGSAIGVPTSMQSENGRPCGIRRSKTQLDQTGE